MVEVNDCTAAGIFSALKKSFTDKKIPMSNIMGYASDTCNTMFGIHHSVSTMLKAEVPYVLTVKCACHMINLCASHACLTMSKTLEDMCRNIYAHFHTSFLRQQDLIQFQEFVNVKPHKLLGIGQTRWLSLEMCVSRVLEQWDALTLYFTSFVSEKRDPSYIIDGILVSLRNPSCKASLEFLQHQVHRLNSFNTTFQTEGPVLHYLKTCVEKLLREIMGDFMHVNVVRSCDVWYVEIENPTNRCSIDHIYVGLAASETILQIGPVIVNQLRTTFCNYLVELVKQIRQRFVVTDPAYDALKMLLPENAMALNPSSLASVLNTFPYLSTIVDPQQADNEWRRQGLDPCNAVAVSTKSAKEYWRSMTCQKDPLGMLVYPNLRKLTATLFSLPTSNTAVERIFSVLKNIKNDKRNSLKRQSLVGLLHARQGLKRNGLSSVTLKPTRVMLSLHSGIKVNATDMEADSLVADILKQ